MKALNLPEPIAAYFSADREDGPAVARCFMEDGVVRDEGQTYVGMNAIEAWKTSASDQFLYSTEPVSFEKKDHQFIVTGRVTGNFPGSPVDLRYRFTLQDCKIASLEITL
ncbi:MAG: nuclear transport factor 2 family protein [Pseudomonadota bacterium]|nr:nuclear transport factor 2 family protein [Pseudomonadota bacterium]